MPLLPLHTGTFPFHVPSLNVAVIVVCLRHIVMQMRLVAIQTLPILE